MAGVLVTVFETTRRLRAERALNMSEARQAYLLALSDAIRPLADTETVKAAASRILGEQLRANRVFYAEVEGDDWIVEGRFERGVAPVPPGRYAAGVYGHRLMDAFRAGHRVVYRDTRREPELTAAQRDAHLALEILAAVGVPLVKQGRLMAVLVVQTADARDWSKDEMALVEETAERTWAAVERAHAQGALRESEERLRALSTATADVIYRMGPDWTEMRALQGRGFLADTTEPSRSWLQQYIEPQDRDTVRMAIEEAIRRKAVFELEHRVRRADGSIGWTLSRAVPLLDAQGTIREWIGTASDITEHKRAEDAQRESEAQMRAIANLVPDLLWRSNARGEVQWYSERWFEYTGQPPQAALGQGWSEVVHPEDLPETLRCWRKAAQTAQPYMRVHRLRRRDGEFRWFLARAEPLYAPDGRVTLWFGSATDIHEQRTARELLEQRVMDRTRALERSSELRRQLLRRVETLQDDERRRIARELHDSLGQLLSAMLLSLTNFRQQLSSTAAVEHFTKMQRLLEAADHELDRIVFTLRPTALEDSGLADAVAAYVGTWSELSGPSVDLLVEGLDGRRLPPQLEAAVFRVIQEALNNIAKHAHAGSVNVSLECRGRKLIASVEDDGVGFEPEQAEPVEGSRPSWGLLSMRERIEALGGTFAIESRVGRGTTVLLRVPLH